MLNDVVEQLLTLTDSVFISQENHSVGKNGKSQTVITFMSCDNALMVEIAVPGRLPNVEDILGYIKQNDIPVIKSSFTDLSKIK